MPLPIPGLLRIPFRFFFFLALVCCWLTPTYVFAQRPPSGGPPRGAPGVEGGEAGGLSLLGSVSVHVREQDGSPLGRLALVTVTSLTNQFYKQATTMGGVAEFQGMMAGTYTVKVVAPGYENANEEVILYGMNTRSTVDIMMKPESNPVEPASPRLPVMAPKLAKHVGKALAALRANKPADAKKHLEEAYRLAPGHPEVNFLYGFYYAELNDTAQAKTYWEKAVAVYPQHVMALLSLGHLLLRENKPDEAIPHLKQAVTANDSSWRAHALLASAYLWTHSFDDAAKEARRSLELGHTEASGSRLVLARALAEKGEIRQAQSEVATFLKERPGDAMGRKLMEELTALNAAPATPVAKAAPAPAAAPAPLSSAAPVATIPLPTNWMPPDVDESVPPVDPAVSCNLNEVLQRAGERVDEFLKNVDRFTATETMKHETINNWGFVSSSDTLKFDYVVTINEVRPGIFVTDEYRNGVLRLEGFPQQIATVGLPSLVLVFHKSQVSNYQMTCEGLARWKNGLAWQVHFVQRSDKPRITQSYRIGNQAHPVALKGRAWILADTYYISRMETDLVAGVPEIQLKAEHLDIEYGPVRFQNRDEEMWLPESAEIYFDWRGRRAHRRHSFSHFLLFSVDDRQKISKPQGADEEVQPQ